MGGLNRSFLIRLALTTVGAFILALLIWFIGPLVQIGESKPLFSGLSRGITIALLVLVLFLPICINLVRRKRAAKELLMGLSQNADRSTVETQKIADTFDKAMNTLSSSSGKKGREAVYDLPWYMFIGAPGSGKTSALVHSGLKFPLGDKNSIKGVGGTRHCDWWFSDQAIFIDTAGRFATQDSDQTLDSTAWKTFLELLKKNRKAQPINGVILTVSVEELHQSAQQRQLLADKLRARLQEITSAFQISPPVYLLVTKADLISGFNQSFETFSAEQRQQGWGFSLDAQAGGPSAEPDSLKGLITKHFEALRQRLENQVTQRLESESDPLKRHAIFGFPYQFSLLKDPLSQIVEAVFGDSTSSAGSANLRGIYLTSGTQQGTAFDRILGSLSQLAQNALSFMGTGKSYFITGVLNQVVLHERGLVGFNPKVVRQKKLRFWTTFAASMLVMITLITLWAVSFTNNKQYVNEVDARIPALRELLAKTPSPISGDPRSILPALNALSTLQNSADFDITDPGLNHEVGLSQVDMMDAGAEISYYRALEDGLMPRVVWRIEERLRNVSQKNLDLAYEALKHYLMLYSPDHFDKESLQAWIELDWTLEYGRLLSAEQVDQLSMHMDNMLKRGAPRPQTKMDEQLVSRVRSLIASYPIEQRIFGRLAKATRAKTKQQLSVASISGPFAAQVLKRQSGQPLSAGIPGLYTVDGYYEQFSKGIAGVTLQLVSESPWVMGEFHNASALNLQTPEITSRVKTLYLNEYIKTWDSVLKDVRLIQPNSLDDAISQARILSGNDSPLRLLLETAARETQLAANAPQLNKQVDPALEKAKSELASLADQEFAAKALDFAGGNIEQRVDNHFQAIHRLFKGEPAPVQQMQAVFNDLFQHLAAVDAAKKSKGTPPSSAALDRIRVNSTLLPEIVSETVATLTQTGSAQARAAERQSLSIELQPINKFCRSAIAGRYPFSKSSKADVLPEDFGQMFGQGGLMDQFFQTRLASLTDTSGRAWRFKPLADGSRPGSGGALASFQKADRIRDVFFRSGGRRPAFRIEIRLVEASDPSSSLLMDLDGRLISFSPNGPNSIVINWPPSKLASLLRVSAMPYGTTKVYQGPWALFRMFDEGNLTLGSTPDKFRFTLNLSGQTFVFDGFSSTVFNPFRLKEIGQFRCPSNL